MFKISTFVSMAALVFCTACAGVPQGDQTARGDPEVQRTVESQFPDVPIMVRVAKCESGLRQYGPSGSVLRGIEHPADSGVFQINKTAHGPTAKKLGIDLDITSGNVAFARLLYDKEGTAPWRSSRSCWGRYHTAEK